MAPDSASYYSGYAPGSTRHPVYPLFIGALMWGRGFDPPAYRAAHREALLAIWSTADPLAGVVRAQIVVLLAAGLVACYAMMRLLESPLPAVLFVWLLDHSFFTAHALNVLLTEALTQTWLFRTVAACMAFLRSPRPWLLPTTAALSGLAYLTRQSAGYTALLPLALIAWSLATQGRRALRAAAIALATLAVLWSLPDAYAFARGAA